MTPYLSNEYICYFEYKLVEPRPTPIPSAVLRTGLTFPLGKGEGTGSPLPLREGPGVRAIHLILTHAQVGYGEQRPSDSRTGPRQY
jgi:hypothetical protein